MRNLSSIPAAVLFGFFMTAFAQDDLLMTLPSPSAVTAPAKTIQPSAVVPEAIDPAAALKNPVTEEWAQELLRDPFWPVGFFPPNWQAKTDIRSGTGLGSSGWKAAFSKLKVSGTSRLGDRTAAIINGQLTGTGEKVEVSHEGKMYQWEITEITVDGQIQLKKLETR